MKIQKTDKRFRKSFNLGFVAVLFGFLSGLLRADYPIMSQHYAADPTAVEWNGRLYVYCSNDEENGENTGYIMDSIVCFSTDDLKNWTDHGVVFDADELSSWYSGTAWAPCIVYHNNKFYLYFGDAYWGIGVVTSDSPTGPFTAPKNALVVTRSTPGANSTWMFDPCVFVDDDGTPYMVFGGGGPNQGRLIQLSTNMIDAVGSAITIEAPDFFEASLMHKYNGTYYYSYADNYEDSTPSSQIAYQTAPSPTGPFTHRGVAVPQPPYNYGNNNHHTFFTFQGEWYCVYHNRYQATIDGVSTTEHRNIGLDRLYYNPDGTIQPLVHTQDGLPQLKYLNPFVRVEGETLAQQSGLRTQVCSEGGMNITAVDNGDWIRLRGVDFGTGAGSFKARVASTKTGAGIELRLDSLSGTLIGTCSVPNTGGPQTWTTVYCNVSGASGVHDLYLKFVGPAGGDLLNLNWWQFQTEPLTMVSVNINPAILYQTIEGLGGAICFYNGWVTAHPYKSEIFTHAFAGLNLSMLRVGNWWRGTNGQDTATYEIVAAANQRLGRPVPILMSSWSPPAYLKSNGQTGGGGTLIQVNGQYDYAGFAEYWYQSLQDYISRGVNPTWITIQNEPDWTADYDSCRFDPMEAEYASYALAQDAVFNRLQSMASPPKLLSPECVGLYGNAAGLRNYLNYLNPNTFYGIAHHLYGGSTDGTPDGYNSAFTTVFNTRNTQFPGKPIFMTEFGDIKGLIPVANLIHNSLVVEQVSGYNHWCLVWPGDIGLVEIEFPWSYYGTGGSWTNPKGYWLNPSYWSMKHYSYYVQPGFRRTQSSSGHSNLLASSYLSPDGKRLVAVLINRLETETIYANLNISSFAYNSSSVFQTVGDQYFQALGPMGSPVVLPPSSVTTIVLDCYGPAAPTGLAATAIVDSQINLTWAASPGALSYNVKRSTVSGGPYTTIGTNITGTAFSDTRVEPGITYYYVVSANTLSGQSADSAEASAARVRTYLRFNETSGTTAADATGGGRNGTLVNGPTWGAGKYGNAVYLDGTNDHVTLPAGVVNGLTDCTISLWVYLNSIGTWSRVFDFGTGTTVNMFLTPRHSNTSGTVRFAITTSGAGGEQRINGTSALPTGAWTHVAVTFSGNTGILYVNGQEVGRNSSMTLNPSSLGNTTQNYLGRSQYAADPYLNGRIDEFRIYSRALSDVEIARLYEEQIPTAVPPIPTGLSAVAVSGTRIDLTWNASDTATNYDIKRALTNGGPYTHLTSVSGTSWSDTGLSEQTAYYYVISAVNSVGSSADSAQVQAVTLADPPAAPTGLTAQDIGGAVRLSWNANTESDLEGYYVWRSVTPGSGYTRLNSSPLNSLTFTDSEITYCTLYYYVVTAADTDGCESGYSNEVSITPADPLAIILTTVDFESGFGNWVNLTGEDNQDWLRNSGGTLTPNTGPSGGANGTVWYAYLETSPGWAYMPGDTAILESPLLYGTQRRLTFYYHMYGAEIGSLFVDVEHNGTWQYGVWSRSGQQHTSNNEPYSQAVVDLSGFTGPIRIRIRAVAAGGSRGDIAVDEITVTGRWLYGDLNGDGVIDLEDLTAFSALWLDTHCELDRNGDCRIDLAELTELAANWLKSF